jgi:hypothetical protein
MYCEHPYDDKECFCPTALNCDDMYIKTMELMSDYDTNGDGHINLGDEIDQGHLGVLAEMCESDGNLSISECEVFNCLV